MTERSAFHVDGSNVYHTDKGCRKLKQAHWEDITRINPNSWNWLRECQTCKHEW